MFCLFYWSSDSGPEERETANWTNERSMLGPSSVKRNSNLKGIGRVVLSPPSPLSKGIMLICMSLLWVYILHPHLFCPGNWAGIDKTDSFQHCSEMDEDEDEGLGRSLVDITNITCLSLIFVPVLSWLFTMSQGCCIVRYGSSKLWEKTEICSWKEVLRNYSISLRGDTSGVGEYQVPYHNRSVCLYNLFCILSFKLSIKDLVNYGTGERQVT